MDPATLNAICDALGQGESGVLIIEMATGRTRFVRNPGFGVGRLAQSAQKAFATGAAFEVKIAKQRYFLMPIGLPA